MLNLLSLQAVSTDLDLYLALRANAPRTLSRYPSLIQNRWTWLVQNWNVYYPQILLTFQGNATLLLVLAALNKSVVGYNLGAQVNPFQSLDNIIYYDPVLSQIPLTDLSLSNQEQVYVSNEEQRVNSFTVTDFRQISTYLNQQASLAVQRGGLGDPLAEQILGYPTTAFERPYLVGDLINVNSLLNLAEYVDGIVYDLSQQYNPEPDLIALANANLDPNNTFTFDDTYITSVAVPFSQSLQEMSKQYLGTEDRWFELVATNDLKAPYVDLYGTKYPLLSPGVSSEIVISNTALGTIVVGGKVGIGSVSFIEEPRTVEVVRDNGDGTITVSLSGVNDLSKFTPNAMAFLRVYIPNTVNATSFILIPLKVAAQFPRQQQPTTNVLRDLNQAFLAFGIDAMRNTITNEFILDSNNDFALSFGVPAIRQTLFYFLKTVAGTLSWHPNYGIPDQIGNRIQISNVDSGTLLADTISRALSQDPRFTSVTVQNIIMGTNSLSMTIVVTLEQSNAVIPLSFVA